MTDLGTWTEPAESVVDRLTYFGVFAADSAVIKAADRHSTVPNPDGSPQLLTGHERTTLAVKAAIRMLLANGLIEALLPSETENVWIVLDPPDGGGDEHG